MRLFLIAFFIVTSTIYSQNQLIPKTPNISDPSLQKFIVEFSKAIKNKDEIFILNSLSENIKVSFDGSNGIKAFKNYWKWNTDNSKFWLISEKILALGGGDDSSSNHYSLPYVFSNWPDNEKLDPYTFMAITGNHVNVRDLASLKNSNVIGQFNYDIVKVNYDKTFNSSSNLKNTNILGGNLWYFVESLDQKTKGYVYWDYIWSPIDYRIGFEKINDKWKISYMIAGD